MKVIPNLVCGFSEITVITLNTILFIVYPDVDFLEIQDFHLIGEKFVFLRYERDQLRG